MRVRDCRRVETIKFSEICPKDAFMITRDNHVYMRIMNIFDEHCMPMYNAVDLNEGIPKLFDKDYDVIRVDAEIVLS